jgi:hypothetical protein
MRALILAAMMAAVFAVPTTALAASGDYPTTTSTDCNVNPDAVTCIDGPDPDDLPTPIDEPDIDDPSGPGEPNITDRVCTSRVTVANTTNPASLQTLIACPGGTSAAGFNNAKKAMLTGAPLNSFPKCNQLNDIIRIHYPFAVGMTFTSPDFGECLRDDPALPGQQLVVVFSRPL